MFTIIALIIAYIDYMKTGVHLGLNILGRTVISPVEAIVMLVMVTAVFDIIAYTIVKEKLSKD